MLYKILVKINTIIYQVFVYPFYKYYFGNFGSQSKIISPNIIEHPKRIFIGNNVLIRRNAWLAANPITGNTNCSLLIGDNTYVGNNAHFYATSKIEIQRKVLIADRVYISDNSHGFEHINIPIIDQPIRQLQEVVIGEGAWLGENVCIIGASVGKNSVVAANSVVNQNIPDYCIAAGIPAKVIKKFNVETKIWEKVIY